MAQENKNIPTPIFQWQGPDGSIVLAITIITSYSATEHEIENRIREYREQFSRSLPQINDVALFYGVGNHGGGPTIATIKKIKALQNRERPVIRFTSPEEYVDKIKLQLKNLPMFKNEIQFHARGCYSACAAVKMLDRQTSAVLLVAEKIASLSYALTSYRYPMKVLQESWKKVLFNQFHDILAGTSIEEAYHDANNDYGYAKAVANNIIMKAMFSLIKKITTKSSAHPCSSSFVVFNPCSWQVQSHVEFETDLLDLRTCSAENTVLRNSCGEPFPREQIVLRDADGKLVPYQLLPTAAIKQENQPFRIRILFKADVPDLGYQVYQLDFSKKDKPPKIKELTVTEHSLENDLVRIQFDGKNGAISSYFDKKLNRELFLHPGAIPIVLDDWDDTWGHRIQAYNKELGYFENAEFRIIESGTERVRLQVKSFWGDSFIVQDFSLYRDSPELECKITINWHEKYRVLKLSFPTVLENGRCTYSISYGFIERPMTGDEVPGQTWVDVSSDDKKGTFGFALLNDSKCGYSVKNGDIRLTVFHSTAWSHHNPEIVTDQDHCRYMDQGIHEFTYKLVPHSGGWRESNIPQRAEEFLMSPLLFHTGNHEGHLSNRASFCTTNLNHISITALKKAEDSDDLILRYVELQGLAAEGLIEIKSLKRKLEFTINPCEIKTFLIPLESHKEVQEVNLLEE